MGIRLTVFIIAAIGFGIISLYMDYYLLTPVDSFTEPMGDSYLMVFGILSFIIAGIIIAVKVVISLKRS